MTILFHLKIDMIILYLLFRFYYACTGSLEAGFISSNNPNEVCTWYFTIPESRVLYVTPTQLDMDQYCIDSVEIYVRRESSWKRKNKFCRLTSYTIDFPTKVSDGPTVAKIEFDPTQKPNLMMFRKLPGDFQFHFQVELKRDGSNPILQLLLSTFANKRQQDNPMIGDVKAIVETDSEAINVCNMIDPIQIESTEYSHDDNRDSEDNDFTYDAYDDYAASEDYDDYYISYRRRRSANEIVEPWRISLVTEDFNHYCDAIILPGTNLQVISLELCNQQMLARPYYAHIGSRYLPIKQIETSRKVDNPLGIYNRLQVLTLERGTYNHRTTDEACFPEANATFEPSCYVNGQKTDVSFACGVVGTLVPLDQHCIKLTLGTCLEPGTPVVCKLHNSTTYKLMGISAWHMEPCGTSGIVGLLKLSYYKDWLSIQTTKNF